MTSDEALVHDDPADGPATHLLVIGCGRYPHLLGGDPSAQMADPDGMEQLSSPPISARAVADWFLTDYTSDKPLASVALLLSEEAPEPYVNPRDGGSHTVALADAASVKAAIHAWKDRADATVDSRAIFYFCGHGIAHGTDVALLLADFGASANNEFEGALDFDKLFLGMARAKAAEQLFLVDACRVASAALLQASGEAGIVPIVPKKRPRSLGVRQTTSLFSTLPGHKAYAKKDQASVFTDAMVKALRGGAASLENDGGVDVWKVDTALLKRAIDRILLRRAESNSEDRPQFASARELMTYDLFAFDDHPSIPVFVRCNDAAETASATLRIEEPEEHGGSVHERAPLDPQDGDTPFDWEFALRPGEYSFSATFDGLDPRSKTQMIRPVFGEVRLESA